MFQYKNFINKLINENNAYAITFDLEFTDFILDFDINYRIAHNINEQSFDVKINESDLKEFSLVDKEGLFNNVLTTEYFKFKVNDNPDDLKAIFIKNFKKEYYKEINENIKNELKKCDFIKSDSLDKLYSEDNDIFKIKQYIKELVKDEIYIDLTFGLNFKLTKLNPYSFFEKTTDYIQSSLKEGYELELKMTEFDIKPIFKFNMEVYKKNTEGKYSSEMSGECNFEVEEFGKDIEHYKDVNGRLLSLQCLNNTYHLAKMIN